MIQIDNSPIDIGAFGSRYPQDSIEGYILNEMYESDEKFRYDSLEQLAFELRMRREIIETAEAMYKSRLSFAIFRKARANPDYWELTKEGGFLLKDGVKPSDAINDIFIHSEQYATECATAMVILYLKALLNIYQEELFNQTFPRIELMNWHYINKPLKEIGQSQDTKTYLPGDRRYFANPDVNPLTPEWQGENVIDLNGRLYYGHGIGINTAENMIRALNENRKENANKSAYLMDVVANPNYKRLANIYINAGMPQI